MSDVVEETQETITTVKDISTTTVADSTTTSTSTYLLLFNYNFYFYYYYCCKFTTTSTYLLTTVADSTTTSTSTSIFTSTTIIISVDYPQLTISEISSSIPEYDRNDWKHWIDENGDCQNTRHEVLIEESFESVTYTNETYCSVSTGK